MSTQKVPARDKIMAAALSVIRTKGYTATTVDDLCESAGVTKGAFFHHFKSKEDMAVAAAKYWTQMTDGFFEGAPYQKQKDPLAKLLGYVDFRKAILKGDIPEYTCLLGTMVQEVYDTAPPIRDACWEALAHHSEDVAAMIDAAKKEYPTAAKVSSMGLAFHIQSVIQGSFILAKAKQNQDVAVESITHLRRYLEYLFQQKGK
jgi:TetR/AcrR family transcriptional repressor of nem operon